jgi:hypothetical protein
VEKSVSWVVASASTAVHTVGDPFDAIAPTIAAGTLVRDETATPPARCSILTSPIARGSGGGWNGSELATGQGAGGCGGGPGGAGAGGG